jgi:hypothetical protein
MEPAIRSAIPMVTVVANPAIADQDALPRLEASAYSP